MLGPRCMGFRWKLIQRIEPWRTPCIAPASDALGSAARRRVDAVLAVHAWCLVRERWGGDLMRLYLMQHGAALAKDVDPARPLSEQGEQDVRRIAAFLARAGVGVGRIWHSGKRRAEQTAELLAAALPPPRAAGRPRPPLLAAAAQRRYPLPWRILSAVTSSITEGRLPPHPPDSTIAQTSSRTRHPITAAALPASAGPTRSRSSPAAASWWSRPSGFFVMRGQSVSARQSP
jgi:Histidine phosphatase superfamily (branch 1)